MLELIFLFIVIPRRMSRLARERNRNPWLWSLGAIGLWIAIEATVIVGFAMALVASALLFGHPKPGEVEGYATLAYLPALVSALIGTQLLYRRLGSRAPAVVAKPSPDAAPYYGAPPN